MSLPLAMALDTALRDADHDPRHLDPQATGLIDLWTRAPLMDQARTVLLLAQRAGEPAQAPALEKFAHALDWPFPPHVDDVLAVADHLRDPETVRRALHPLLDLAATIYAPGQEPCPFCLIATDQAPARIIAEDREWIAFVPLQPVVPGHWLIVPRLHVDDALSVPEITGMVTSQAATLLRKQGPDALNMILSVKEAATRTVCHLHLHAVPREFGDGLALPWDPMGLAGLPDPKRPAHLGVIFEHPRAQTVTPQGVAAYLHQVHGLPPYRAAKFTGWLWPRRSSLVTIGATWEELISLGLSVWDAFSS